MCPTGTTMKMQHFRNTIAKCLTMNICPQKLVNTCCKRGKLEEVSANLFVHTHYVYYPSRRAANYDQQHVCARTPDGMRFKHFIFTAKSFPDLHAVSHFGLLASTKGNSDPVFYLKASYTTMGCQNTHQGICHLLLNSRQDILSAQKKALHEIVLEGLLTDAPALNALLLKFCTMESTASHWQQLFQDPYFFNCY